jgi:hypothetical protein
LAKRGEAWIREPEEKMRNDVKTNVLLQGRLPKIKMELYLRMLPPFSFFFSLFEFLNLTFRKSRET